MNKKKIVLLVVVSAMLTTQVLAFEVNSTLKLNSKLMFNNSEGFSWETMSWKILQRQETKKEVTLDLNEQISKLDSNTKEVLWTLRIEFEKELETYGQAIKDWDNLEEVKAKVKTITQSFIASANEAWVNLDLATKIFEARIRVFFENQLNSWTCTFVKSMLINKSTSFNKETRKYKS